jgi:hypothetical protein
MRWLLRHGDFQFLNKLFSYACPISASKILGDKQSMVDRSASNFFRRKGAGLTPFYAVEKKDLDI